MTWPGRAMISRVQLSAARLDCLAHGNTSVVRCLKTWMMRCLNTSCVTPLSVLYSDAFPILSSADNKCSRRRAMYFQVIPVSCDTSIQYVVYVFNSLKMSKADCIGALINKHTVCFITQTSMHATLPQNRSLSTK